MRYFAVPFDIRQEDKVIGGYISMRQLLWMLVPVILVFILFLIDRSYIVRIDNRLSVNAISLVIRIIVSVAVIGMSTLLAFYKVNGENYDKYALKKLRYSKRAHILKYRK